MLGDRWQSHDGRIVVYHADAREWLPTLADASVDAFVTDPPYGIEVGAAFVRGSKDVFDGNESMNLVDGDDPVWFVEEAARVLVPGGQAAIFHGAKHRLHVQLRIESAGIPRWNTFYLVNNAPPCTPRQTFASAVQECQIGAKLGATRRWFGGGATPNTWIGAPVAKGWASADYTGHTAQKPLGCMKRLCKALAPVDGLVCDPFLGSGTTACACVALGQRFIGCEREREWFEKACQRIERHAAQGRLL
jgi:site-specific DNA-methyltransferase (adenine-specific)